MFDEFTAVVLFVSIKQRQKRIFSPDKK